MLQRCQLCAMRVLCLTMLPDGGAMTTALQKLGYTPYTLSSVFREGNPRTQLAEWAALLEGRKGYDATFFASHDCFVGPPAAMLYDIILRGSPAYTKVILVTEPAKAAWAAAYEREWLPLRAVLQRINGPAKRDKRGMASLMQNAGVVLECMVVRGTESVGDAAAGKASSTDVVNGTSDAAGAAGATPRTRSVADASIASTHHETMSSATRLRSALAAASDGTQHTTSEAQRPSDATDDVWGDNATDESAASLSPRAMALAQYEMSVKLAVPESRLLVYRHGDGWEPLCTFLERPVPDLPFPAYDDGLQTLRHMRRRVERAQRASLTLNVVVALCLLVSLVPLLRWAVRAAKEVYIDYKLAFGTDKPPENKAPTT